MPGEPGDEDDDQVAVRHADVSGGFIIENQHEEKRKRDVQVKERGSEATNEEQMDERRKTVRFEREPPNTSASSDPNVALEHLVRSETPSRLVSVLVQKLFVRWMYSTRRMNARIVASEKCWRGIEEEMPEISREVNWMYWLRIEHVS